MSRLERRWDVEGVGKYGFVYKWIDRGSGKAVGRGGKAAPRKKRYYIGSHWGKFGDGYVCSSRAMNAAYKKRPHDFSRRILAVVTTNRVDLLAAEQAALDKMPRSHFGGKAYNVSTNVKKPWWAKGSKLRKATVRRLEAAWQNPERKRKASETATLRQYSEATRAKMSKSARRRWTPEERAKQSEACTGREPWNKGTKGLVPAWNKGTEQPPLRKSHRAKIANSLRGRTRPPEVRKKLQRAARTRWLSAEYRKKITESRQAARTAGKLKITPKQAHRIRRMHATGKYTLAVLARKFDVSASYVHGVLHGAKRD